MPIAGFSTTVKAGGPSSALSNAPTTRLAANTVYQVTDAAKRVLDPSVVVTVEVDADGAGAGGYVVAAPSSYRVDYLFGRITFDSDQGASALVRVSGAYLSPVDVAEAKEASVSLVRTLAESNIFHPDGYKRKTATLKDASGTIGSFAPLQRDQDEDGTTNLAALFASGTPFLLEVRFGGTGDYFRAWVLIPGIDDSFSPDGLYDGKLNWNAAPVRTGAALGFGQ